MSYIVTTNFYEGNTLHEEGSVFEHSDADYVKKCLDDGNITDSNDDDATAKVAQAAKIAAVNEAVAKEHEARDAAATGVAVDSSNPLADTQQDLESSQAPVNPPVVPAPTTEPAVPPVTQGQPTEAEIAQTLNSVETPPAAGSTPIPIN